MRSRAYDGRVVRGLLAVALVLVATLLGTAGAPAATTAANSGLTVRIDGLTPTTLSKGATVAMSGVVSNTSSQTWRNAYAYLVIARSPFTTRSQVENAITTGDSYTGDRIVDVGYFDELGDLASGASTTFQLKVPWERLHLTGAEGIYPVGVQILATDADGSRTNTALARASTFLPLLGSHRQAVPTGLVWTFGLPALTGSAADDTRRLVATISRGGTMRRQLALAEATPHEARTILLDPALLDAVAAISDRQGLPSGVTVTRTQSHAATALLDDLLDLVRGSATWVMGYGRPDTLALATHSAKSALLRGIVDRATDETLAHHQISGRQISYPSAGGFTREVLTRTRETDVPFLVSESALPDWEQSLGSVVSVKAANRSSNLIVNSTLPDVAGVETTVTLRQSVLACAALASLSRASDADSRADALTFVDPSWTPVAGASTSDIVDAVSTSGLTTATTGEDLLREDAPGYPGTISTRATDRPLSAGQLEAAATLAGRYATFSALIDATDDQRRVMDVTVAEGIATRWRNQRSRALKTVKAQTHKITKDALNAVTVTGPPNVTLSGRTGSFPLTIANPTSHVVHVKVDFSTSNSAVRLKDVAELSVDPRERRTVDATIDVGEQSSTTVTAQLQTSSGVDVGHPTEFNVRSSQVGLIAWIAIALAGVLIVVAFGRRFLRGSADDESAPDDAPEGDQPEHDQPEHDAGGARPTGDADG